MVIDDLPAVSESAVIGVADADFGEAVTAVVVVENGAQINEAATISTLKTKLAGYKVPKRIHVVEALPRNAMGKVQKTSCGNNSGSNFYSLSRTSAGKNGPEHSRRQRKQNERKDLLQARNGHSVREPCAYRDRNKGTNHNRDKGWQIDIAQTHCWQVRFEKPV